MQNRYCLQMVACGSCVNGGGADASSNIYSTAETVCGTWIDGKPIYRKVIVGTMQKESGPFAFADVADLEIDRLIDLYGNMVDNHNDAHITLQFSLSTLNGIPAAVNMYYTSQEEKIMCYLLNNSGLYSGSTAYVILEYTKKTDRAS